MKKTLRYSSKILMHVLYKRKKALFIVALFCMNSIGSFMPLMKALPTKSISNRYVPFSPSELPERIARIVKSREKEYTRIIQYYKYKADLGSVWMGICVLLVFSFAPIVTIYSLFKNPSSFIEEMKKDKMAFFALVCMNIMYPLWLYQTIVSLFEARHKGAIFLTDTGILFIPSDYNGNHGFIPYQDITKVSPSSYKGGWVREKVMSAFLIQFVKKNSDSDRVGIAYSDHPSSIIIEKDRMSDEGVDPNAFLDLYRYLSVINEKTHMKAMREKAKEESAQEKGKSLLTIKKEEGAFIDRLDKASNELYEKAATVEFRHPEIFTQIEAYYPYKVVTLMIHLLIEVVFIAMFALTWYDLFYNPNPLLNEFAVQVLLLLSILLFFLGREIFNRYVPSMHPAGLFITDTGLLSIEEGSKLKYTFIRYENMKELLRDETDKTLLVRSTQSTHETSSKVDGTMPQTLKIEYHRMEEKVTDLLYEHLRLKIAAIDAGKSRLKT